MKNWNKIHRRSFLKSSVIGTTAALLGGRAMASNSDGKTSGITERKLIYRVLGKTGIRLPVISMGVMRADNPALVRASLDKGIVMYDTAHGYMRGNNETMLGEVFKDVPRNKIIIATKIKLDGVDRTTGAFTDATSADKLVELLEVSLQRLQFDYVDILYVHDVWSREAALYEPVINTLQKLKALGKIRYAGMSTHRNMAVVIRAAVESKFYDVVLTSYNFQMMNNGEMKEALALAGKEKLGIVAMKTMAGGFLDRERTKPVNCKAALKWALQNENICTAIPGFTALEHVESACSVMDNLELTDEEMNQLENDAGIAGLFCEGCSNCQHACKRNLPVPDLMRAYMYTYGYHEYNTARELVCSFDLGEDPCEGCEECTVRCSRGLAVAERISDISRIRNVPAEYFT